MQTSCKVVSHFGLSWKDQICIHENNIVFVLLTNRVDVSRMYSTSCLRQISAPGLGRGIKYVQACILCKHTISSLYIDIYRKTNRLSAVSFFCFSKGKRFSNRVWPNRDLRAQLGRIILVSYWHHKKKQVISRIRFYAFNLVGYPACIQ